MMAIYWEQTRHWIASRIMGMNIFDAIDESYEMGRKYGNFETLRKLGQGE